MLRRQKMTVAICVALSLTGYVLFSIVGDASAKEVTPFGIEKFTLQTTIAKEETVEFFPGFTSHIFLNEPYLFTQAGGHPVALTATLQFKSEGVGLGEEHTKVPTRDPKDIVTDLPAGLLGDPQAVPRCPLTVILDKGERCPTSTQVGVVRLLLLGEKELIGPIVNLTPENGQSAEFGLENESKFTYVLSGHVVHTATGYGLTVVSNEIPATEIISAELTFWGVPADQSHNAQRGQFCDRIKEELVCQDGGAQSGEVPVPFLTLPTECAAGPETAVVHADSWEEPGRYVEAKAELPGVTGCENLQFGPSIEVQPDTTLADEPVGLGVNVRVPQVENPAASATPQLRDAVVTLPEGMSVSPGIVDGIQACDATGPSGINIPNGLNAAGEETKPGEAGVGEEIGANGEPQLAPGDCPDASIVGTAEAETPLLGSPVKGHVYLARPACGGAGERICTEQDALDGELYRLYLELGGTGALASSGVNLKVEGMVETNPATGQITTKFLGNPPLPFSELRIRLNGGPRAPLDTPATCGPAVTTADFTPWSEPGFTPEPNSVFMPGTPDAVPSSFFDVTGCAEPPGLNPSFLAGTVTPQAGQFSPFTLTFTRKDREQYVAGIQVHTPLGLLGMLSSVPLCGEPLAQAGECPASSRIGGTMVSSGAGSHPFEIAGDVYLTTGYKGAPFGLSIVTHVVAGPFNLGLVVVRARIDVNPETSALTVTSDPLPQIVFGVPLRLQRVTVDIDRPGFMFNPTSCAALAVDASIGGAQGAVANVSSPFAVGGCKSLAFKPQFKVSTNGHTGRTIGASLDAKLTYPSGSFGNEANVARVKVSLPKALPSKLSTLQKACSSAVFTANPASCPMASIVGSVRSTTPVLPGSLSGPVYFVSHGGEEFPSLIMVLQGDGVRVDLTGATFIDKAGITSSTFKTVPDVPVESFEIYLPQGRDSALAANGSLCGTTITVKRKIKRRINGHLVQQTVKVRVHKPAKLIMPTEFVAQNGAVFRQSTKIEVSGCAAAKAATAAHRAAAGGTGGSSFGERQAKAGTNGRAGQ